ncbi:uncharacterized protein LOC131327077 [Rhododendron vialii]|uniref:uncharacterized protein LOC131327077 n=1 Tax=Rhododendron vialii TaxID=182163 RepID=UPI00265DA3BF|nr:uncharacterized protein LOC131327077 [Rhododendron vialii]
MEYLRHLNYYHHHLCLLLLLLLLANFPSTMANWKNNVAVNPDDSNNDIEVTYGFSPPAPADARDEDQTNKGEWFQCRCPPSAFECPITLEPEAYKQLKNNLGPVIRQRLTELLKKALTVESAIEAAQTIDLLKLLNESNTELNAVRENMQNGAQQLRDAFLKLPEIM